MRNLKLFSSILAFCIGMGNVSLSGLKDASKGMSLDSIVKKLDSWLVDLQSKLFSDIKIQKLAESEPKCLKIQKVESFSIVNGKVIADQKPDEIIFVIDKSGSMDCSRRNIVDGFNEILQENKKLSDEFKAKGKERKANITIKFFSSKIDSVREKNSVENIKELTMEDYQPGGLTALFDTVGGTLDEILKTVPENSENSAEQKPLSNVLLYIMTDGAENDSRIYDGKKVTELMDKFRKLGGEVRFIGAGPEAYDQYKTIGVPKNCTMNFKNNSFNLEDRRAVMESCTRFRSRN